MTPSQQELTQIRAAASAVDSELDLLLALSEHVIAEPSLDELLWRLCTFAAELIDAELMLVPMLDDTRTHYRYVAASGASSPEGPTPAELLHVALPVEAGLCGWVLRNRAPVLHGEGHDLPFGEQRRWDPQSKSSLLVPLLSRGEIIGGLSGIGKRGGGSFSERDLKLLTLFANHTSVALGNAQMVERERTATLELLAAKQRAEQQARELAAALDSKQRLEQELQQAQKMESLGRLAGGIAHDFNNILVTLGGSVELAQLELRELGVDSSELNGLLDDAMRAVGRAGELTKQLLAFARRQVIDPRPFEAGPRITGAVSMLRRVLDSRIELRCELAPDLYLVCADPGQFEQVLVNLTLTARDALPQGGRIEIRACNRSVAAGELLGHDGPVAPGEYLSLRVEDNGSGIDAELLPRLFEPFVTSKAAGTVTGLGLAICYGIVKQIGGAIRVDSQLGVGTRFELLFPRAHAPLRTPAHTPAYSGQVLAGKTIWVVDDDDDVRNMVRATLTTLGHSVHTSRDGLSALAELSDTQVEVDLLITDILMPGLDGLELVERLDARRPGLNVLFMSGYPAEHYRDIADSERRFLQKPFRTQQLAERLHQLLTS